MDGYLRGCWLGDRLEGGEGRDGTSGDIVKQEGRYIVGWVTEASA